MSIKDFKIRSLITHYRKNKRPTIGSIQRISSFLYFISSDLAVFNLKFLDYQIWALSSKWKYNYYIRLYKYVFPCQTHECWGRNNTPTFLLGNNENYAFIDYDNDYDDDDELFLWYG